MFAGDAADNRAEEGVAVVAVCPAAACFELQRGGVDAAEHLFFAAIFLPVGFGAADAACVVEQVADGDGLPAFGGFGQVGAHGLVEADFAVFHQQHHGGGGEHFADGGRLKHGVSGHGNLVFDIRQPVALLFDGFTVAVDAECDAGDFLAGKLGLGEVVYGVGKGGEG